MNFLKIAVEYHALGFNIIPIGTNKRPISIRSGTKLPTDDPEKPFIVLEKTQPLPWGAGGMKFDTLRQSERGLQALPWDRAKGIAAICGDVSGGMVCVDFDNFTDLTFPHKLLGQLNLDPDYPWLYETGKGYQIWFRCLNFSLPKSNKLDRKALSATLPNAAKGNTDDSIKLPHIELRWNGHYSILPPSIHPSGKQYTFVAHQETVPPKAPALVEMSALLAAYDSLTVNEDAPKSAPHANSKEEQKKTDSKKKYLAAAIQGEVDKLNASPNGQGNNDLYESAMKLGGFVKSGALGEAELYAALMTTHAATRRPEPEARATIASGLKNAEPRTIPEPAKKGRKNQSKENATDAVSSATIESYPYIVIDRCIHLIKTRMTNDGVDITYEPIADFTAKITQQIRDEQGALAYKIEGETLHGKKFTLQIAARDFEETSKCAVELGSAAGANAGIHVGMARHLAYAVKRLSGIETPEIRSFKRTGWWQGRFLLPGRGFTDATVNLPGDLPFMMSDKAELTQALPALEALINSVGAGNSLPVLMAIFGAPLADLAGYRDERYTTLIHGRTGKFKTSFAQTALCIYGEGFSKDKSLIKWGDGATENAIEAIASHAHDLPILVDNYKPNTGGGERVLVRVIHRMAEGGGKKRLNRDAELRVTPDLYAWLLITGEDTSISDTAMIARQLWVAFDDQPPDASNLLAQAQDNVMHLPAIGRIWIEFLESAAGQKGIKSYVEKLRKVQKEVLKQLIKANPSVITGNPQRLARNIAYNRLVFGVLCQHPVLGALFKPHEAAYNHSIGKIATEMAKKAVESNPAEIFITTIRDLFNSGSAVLIKGLSIHSTDDINDSEARRMVGYKAPDGGAYLIPARMQRALNDLAGPHILAGTTPNALYKRLYEQGYLASISDDSRLASKKIRGKTMRVLHLTKEAIAYNDTKATE